MTEKLKKSRKVSRWAFTRDLSLLNTALETEGPDAQTLQVRLAMLTEKYNDLESVNQKIMEVILESDASDEQFAQEVEAADDYRAKFHLAKTVVSNALTRGRPIASTSDVGPVIQSHRENMRSYKLPKIELPTFSGELKDWLQFWSLFKNIHDNPSISKEDKFQYLFQAMVKDSRASEVVNSFPPIAANYDKAITSLKNRFGREDLLVEVYVRELLKLVLNKTKISSCTSLSKIYDRLETHLRSLESLGVTTDMCAAMLYPLVESSLPEDLLRVWQRNNKANASTTSKQRLDDLMTFLPEEVLSEERIAMAVDGFGLNDERPVSQNKDKKKNKTEPKEVATAAGLLSTKEVKSSCIFCDQIHDSALCIKAKKMSHGERSQIVKEKNACYNCLKTGHSFKFCKYKERCAWCGKRHVLIMCRSMTANTSPEKSPKTVPSETQEQPSLASISLTCEIFLQTLRIKLYNRGKERVVKAVFDTGSHRSYILEQYAKELGLEIVGEQQIVHLLFGGSKSKPQLHRGYKVSVSSLDDSYSCNFVALSQEVICQNVPSVKKGPWLDELQQAGIKLTDIESEEAVTILIGADIAEKLLTGRRKELKSGAVALETLLGWTLIGKVNVNTERREDSALMVVSMVAQKANVADLWKLDILGITDPIQKKTREAHQEEVKERFRQTIRINEEERYEVSLPWKEDHPPLADNKNSALRRLETAMKKIQSLGLYDQYQEILDEWIAEGIIEKVPATEMERDGYYLPHRPVIKEGSTTRIRPVFDASAMGSDGLSLNQCLETGPNLIELIPNILLRFRRRRLGVVSDIRKAFLQISVSPTDRDVLRFLWRRKTHPEEVEVYRHRRVVFGVSSSPFLLGGIIEYHLESALLEVTTEEEIEVIQRLQKSFYVDNCITSVDSEDELLSFEERAKQIMARKKFDLRGWEYTEQKNPEVSAAVLGLIWNKEDDTLSLAPSLLKVQIASRITKRAILSAAQRIFDPIGLASPVFLKPKLLLQKLWSEKIGWDTEIPENIRSEFNEWQKQLFWLKDLRVPRWAFRPDQETRDLSFHMFVDASKDAYAAVLFTRIAGKEEIYVQLIAAKSRIAPAEKTTIPRLELLAASIGARLWHSIKEALDIKEASVTFWSDSTTALAWIKTDKPWNTFVTNRVKEIRKLTSTSQWFHVPGDTNPADLPSRGCKAKYLIESRWWEGPLWLKLPKDQWPTNDHITDEEEINRELKKSADTKKSKTSGDVTLVDTCMLALQEKEWYMKRQSKYSKIIRTIAWTFRFVNNCRLPRASRLLEELTAKEFVAAELVVLRLSQQESFTGTNDPRLSTLKIYKNEDGLLRLKSPVMNREDEYNFRYPIVLDPKHPLTKKLIEYRHLQLNHAGVQITMNNLREMFWILKCRATVRTVINNCVICKRHQVDKIEAISGDLPNERVREANVFEVVGIDYIGPLFLKKSQKAWICLFTCAIYRAVHLELTTSMTTDAFLQVLRRFIARRGRPSIIFTDNGTNFVGARNLLGKINWRKIRQYSTTQKIDWRLNPPSAPWWGGWWERLVRITKNLLKKTLKKVCLSFEEMNTILCDCEAIINSRPLGYVANDPTQPAPLTPAMFLQEIPQNEIPDLDKLDVNLSKRMRYRQSLREDLRKRFRSEYLGQLSRRVKGSSTTIKEGDIVLLGHDNLKRLDWPLARVVKIFPGKDGVTRVVKVKTATGELVRPVQRLYPLEMFPDSTAILEQDVDVPGQTQDDEEFIPADTIEETRTRSGRRVKIPDRLGF